MISVIDNKSPLPPVGASDEDDAVLLQAEPYIDGPIKVDYGTNLRFDHLNDIPVQRAHFSDLVKEFISTSTAHSSIRASLP